MIISDIINNLCYGLLTYGFKQIIKRLIYTKSYYTDEIWKSYTIMNHSTTFCTDLLRTIM